ncbi:MAG: tail fiber domain-containing protein [Vicinamibacterales bacterium]
MRRGTGRVGAHGLAWALSALAAGVCPASAGAQTLGTFTWQMQPFCNVVSLTITQVGSSYSLTGVDDLCGAPRRGPITGLAAPNPDGTIGFSFDIGAGDRGNAQHVDAAITLAGLSGPWTDDGGQSGTFAFGGSAAGSVRPTTAVVRTVFSGQMSVVARKAGGSAGAPANTPTGAMATFGAQGYLNGGFAGPRAYMQILATEPWASGATGSSIQFLTTANGSQTAIQRLLLAHNGNVGIGTNTPLDLLHVNGSARVTCLKDASGVGIAGTCPSDARFKRDVTPFASSLEAVAALRPVHYFWRTDAYPDRQFGQARASGLIAQEVERTLPDLVVTGDDGYKAIDYSQLPLLAIQAIGELKRANDALAARLAAVERALAERQARR